MRSKRLLAHFLALSVLLGAASLTLVGCAGKDELGNKYKNKDESTEAAIGLIGQAADATDLIPDIEYDIALMVGCDTGSEHYELGVKNSYSATDRGTEESNVYCHKTYYGTQGNEVAAYYRSRGYIHTVFCDTHVRAPISEAGFYEYVNTTSFNAETDFFDPKRFESGCIYTYGDGTRAAVFRNGNGELGKLIADFLGFTDSAYVYECSELLMRCDINAEGTVESCALGFKMVYYKAATPEQSLLYRGDFRCTVKNTGESVTVKAPDAAVKYQTVADFGNLRLLLTAYDKLASFSSIAAEYKRTVVNEDGNSKYSLETEARFTQAYRDGVYTYGSIDLEKSTTPAGSDRSSVGVFVDAEGQHHYRDFAGNDRDTKNEATVEEWLASFVGTVTQEYFYGEDIYKITASEADGVITFTFKFNDETMKAYAQYVLKMLAGENEVNVAGQNITAITNEATVKVRLSDGCLIHHSIRFAAVIGYSVMVSSEFSLDVTATGDSVEVLDLGDWRTHVAANK